MNDIWDRMATAMGYAAGQRIRAICREAGMTKPLDIEIHSSFGTIRRRIFDPMTDSRDIYPDDGGD